MKNKSHVGLSRDIVQSELWTFPDLYLRIWLFLLVIANEDGIAHCAPSIGALWCQCTVEAWEEALEKFCEPSPLSRRKNNEGRKLLKQGPAEYLIINFVALQNEHKAEVVRENDAKRKRVSRAKQVAK